MPGPGFQVARVRGIPIRVDVSFVVGLPLLAVWFGHNFVAAARLAGIAEARLGGSPWTWGLAIAVALFASVLVHELAHSLYCVRRGGEVRSITLLVFGGASEISRPPPSEAAMAAAGPATSLGVGVLCWALSRVAERAGLPNGSFALFYLAQTNLALAAFNLMPAFPMDGGRILRAVLARSMGVVRATRIAATIGRGFAVLFAGVGFLAANFLLVLVSLFVYVAAEREARDVLLRAALGELHVREIMSPVEGVVLGGESLAVLSDRMRHARVTAYPVTEGDRVLGVATARGIAKVPLQRRAGTCARDVALPATVVGAGDPAREALSALRPDRRVVVVDEGQVVGTVSVLDVLRAAELGELSPWRSGR